jgi:rod shape-determining protein MreC
MAATRKRLHLPILFAVLFVLPLASLFFHGRDASRRTLGANLLSGFAAPGQYVVAAVIDGVASTWYSYVYLVDVETQNKDLREERKKLIAMVHRCQESREENARLQRLLNFREGHEEHRTVTARVLARDTSPYFRVLRVVLDRGTEDGVRPGMPVVTHQGVVGKVERVTGRYCDVMLLTDSRSRLSATVAGKGVTGMVAGSGDGISYTVTFHFPFQKTELDADDLLVTTGHEQIFPKGLEIGRLLTGAANPSGKHQEVQVVTSVDFNHMQEVLIITNYQHETTDPWKEEDENGN